jgi:hypothetical protein
VPRIKLITQQYISTINNTFDLEAAAEADQLPV